MWAFLLLLAACQPAPPPPSETPSPTTSILSLGLAESAASLASLVAGPYHDAAAHIAPQFTLANDATLLDDLSDAAGPPLFDAILIHDLPPGSPYWFNPVALDGLVLVVHPDNPMDNLSLAEAQAIFSGRLANWSAVGGPEQPIALVAREPGSGARAIFNQRVLAEQRLAVTAAIASSQADLLAAVAADPAAIGYATLSGLDSRVKALTLDGLAATPETTADQSYPLTAPLYWVSPAEPQGELRHFLAWLQSPAGQQALGVNFGRVR